VSYLLVQGQQSMTLDSQRNEAYAKALAKLITPESVVLDLGAGLGIHGLLAAKLGAKRVYLVEPEDIISVAAQIAKANGYSDRVHCLQGKIEDVTLPEQVDVIISVFTGNFLLEEDLLPSLFYARDKYLKPGGVMIPQAAVMEVVPVCATELYQQEIESWSVPHMDINHAPARMYASQSIYYYSKDLDKAHYLAEPAKLLTLDFYHTNSTYCQAEAKFAIAESGVCHGFAGWFKMQLGETWLSTAPHEPPLHWSAAFLPLDPPIELTVGEEVTFKLQRPPCGDWTWQVKTAQAQQNRSTFFSVPRTLKSIKQVAWDYQPQINDKGKAALFVLSQSNGTLSVEALSHHLVQDYPHLFAEPHKAISFVQNLVSRFS
jgi:predicted RNA methylase